MQVDSDKYQPGSKDFLGEISALKTILVYFTFVNKHDQLLMKLHNNVPEDPKAG
jgi:hypothetical protein